VLVQALATGAPSIRHAARHDASGFLAGELARRRVLRYPPFSHLIEIALASEDEERVERSAETVRELVGDRLAVDDDLLGPASLFRLRGRHRRRLLVKSDRRHDAVEAVRDAVATAVRDRALQQVSISVDVDPQ
jgi:primosomal protein N' (replication factor Y)